MERLTCWLTATRFRLRQASVRRVLAGVTLLTLVLGATGLLLTTPPAASAAQTHADRALEAVSRPSRTPTPTRTATPTSTPASTPTAPSVPRPTTSPTKTAAPPAPTAVATGIGSAGTSPAGPAGSGQGDTQAAGDTLRSLLGWGLAVLLTVALGTGVVLLRSALRTAGEHEQSAFDPSAQHHGRARLNQLHQLLPGRQTPPPLAAGDTRAPQQEEGHAWEPLLSPPEPLWPVPLKPPRWLIDAGLLKEFTGNLPAADPEEPHGPGQERRDGPDQGAPGVDGG